MDDTCVQFPPVDVLKKWVSSDLVTASVLKTHPLVHLFGEQPFTERLRVRTEVLRIVDRPRQHALLHLLTVDLKKRQTSHPPGYLTVTVKVDLESAHLHQGRLATLPSYCILRSDQNNMYTEMFFSQV